MSIGQGRRKVILEAGKTYYNNTTPYKVLKVDGDIATVQQPKTGWTCIAHGTGMYDSGKIDWDFSTNGYFAEVNHE